MNTDKAYIYGLIIGGGVFGNNEDTFRIDLPYNKWGSLAGNTQRVEEIQRDIMRYLSPLFRTIYGLSISYESTKSGKWSILCEGDTTALILDLSKYDVNCAGTLRTNVDISKIVAELVDDNFKRRFIAGFADTIGSLAKSQRRFNDDKQIISFEIKGFNYTFVCQLCRLLHSIKCYPDQVLWQHPNIQSGCDSYYKNWSKGFKLRVLLDQYSTEGSFAFRAKALGSVENKKLQNKTNTAKPCPEQNLKITASCVHFAENDIRLPVEIRGGHYIHYQHICTVMGCEHAQANFISQHFSQIGEWITPFPILSRESAETIELRIANDKLMSNRKYDVRQVRVKELFEQYRANSSQLLYGNVEKTGYSIAEIMQGVSYIIADKDELHGKKPRGGFAVVLEKHIADNADLTVEVRIPDLLTPVVIIGNGRGALIGARNPDVYEKLVSRATDNEYKLCVRPITEEDLTNA